MVEASLFNICPGANIVNADGVITALQHKVYSRANNIFSGRVHISLPPA